MHPLPNASTFAGCDPSCDQLGTQVSVFIRIRAAARVAGTPPPHAILYMNAVYDWPFYRAHSLDIDVADVNGIPHAEESDPGIFPSYFYDFGREAAREAFLGEIRRNVGEGQADGVYLDCFPTVPLKCNKTGQCSAIRNHGPNNKDKASVVTQAQVDAYTAGKNDTLIQAGQVIANATGGNGAYVAFIAGVDTYGPSHGGTVAVLNGRQAVTPDVLAKDVATAFASGYKYLIWQPNRFSSPTGGGRKPEDRTDMVESMCEPWQIAKFLLALEPNCFIACNGWSEDFKRPLGDPTGPATVIDGVLRRKFASGTEAQWTVGQPCTNATFQWGSPSASSSTTAAVEPDSPRQIRATGASFPGYGVQRLVAGKAANRRQAPANGDISLLNYHFFAEIFVREHPCLSGASLQCPAQAGSLRFPTEGEDREVHGGRYSSESELDRSFPDGPYIFHYNTTSSSPSNQTVRLEKLTPADFIPKPISVSLMQGGEPVHPLRVKPGIDLLVQWSRFANGGDDPNNICPDLIFFELGDCFGGRLMASGEPFANDDARLLTFRNTSINIDGSLLGAGRTYQISVEQSKKVTSRDATTGVPALPCYETTTYLDFNTTGSPGAGAKCPDTPFQMDPGQTDRPARPPTKTAAGTKESGPLPGTEQAASAGPIVHTPYGQIQGLRRQSTEQFLGIKYAEPPVKKLRFRPAVPIQPWGNNTTMQATNPLTPACFQPFADEYVRSEDCLTISIWRPIRQSTAEKLPTIVWVHGGGMVLGSTHDAAMDGTNLAASQEAIVVSINYRLGPLGFLSSAEIKAESGALGGMNGVRDALVALKFARSILPSFGGDVNRLTLMGQSAGALAVCSLVFSPLSTGLFDQAIIQSGPCIGNWGPGTSADALNISAQVMTSVGARSLEQLRHTPAADLVWPATATNNLSFPGFFVDGYVLPRSPEVLLKEHGAAAVNVKRLVIGGTTMDGVAPYGGSAVVPLGYGPAEYLTWMAAWWGLEYRMSAADSLAIAKQYPLSRPEFNNSSAAAFIRADADFNVICPVQRLARALSTPRRGSSATEVWVYSFAHGPTACDEASVEGVLPVDQSVKSGWASHASDVLFTFDSDELVPSARLACPFTKAEQALSERMMSLWASFTAHSIPNAAGAPEWPQFLSSGASGQVLQLDTGVGLKLLTDFRHADCAFWDALHDRRTGQD